MQSLYIRIHFHEMPIKEIYGVRDQISGCLTVGTGVDYITPLTSVVTTAEVYTFTKVHLDCTFTTGDFTVLNYTLISLKKKISIFLLVLGIGQSRLVTVTGKAE